MSCLTTYSQMQCIRKVAWLPGPLHYREEKKRTGNKVGDRAKKPEIETNLGACDNLKNLFCLLKLSNAWPIVISWRRKNPTKNMKYSDFVSLSCFSIVFWDKYELKESDN